MELCTTRCRTGTCKKAEEGIQRWKHNLCNSILVIQCHTRVEGRRLRRLSIGETTWRVWMQQLAILCRNISSGRWWWRIQLLNNTLPPSSLILKYSDLKVPFSRLFSQVTIGFIVSGLQPRNFGNITWYRDDVRCLKDDTKSTALSSKPLPHPIPHNGQVVRRYPHPCK